MKVYVELLVHTYYLLFAASNSDVLRMNEQTSQQHKERAFFQFEETNGILCGNDLPKGSRVVQTKLGANSQYAHFGIRCKSCIKM